ncbi:50S ribosomal protein L4 [Patescibacteria group bacterium]|nr:50S ribosomal protein L4 [Patescibacteria group bacterium]
MPSVKSETKNTRKAGKKENPPQPSFKKEGARLELPVFNQEGQEVEKISLPVEIFGLKVNNDLIKQAVEAQMSQARIPYAHAKDRSEVRGGGKKPWRQKGTGRARHGSIRSPIWRGGGVTHGPRKEKNFAKKINKQMKRQALLMVLSGKMRDNEIIVLDDLKLEQPKTKLMAGIIQQLVEKVKNDLNKGALIAMPQKDENIIRAARNIPKIDTIGVNSLNVVDLLSYKYLLMSKEAIEMIKKTYKKERP